MERKTLRDRIEALKQRLYRNAVVQEGERPREDPAELGAELERETLRFADLVARIQHANARERLADGRTLAQALVQRDMLHLRQLVQQNLAQKANTEQVRYSNRELRLLPAVDVAQAHARGDALAREARLLDLALQQRNWEVELDGP